MNPKAVQFCHDIGKHHNKKNEIIEIVCVLAKKGDRNGYILRKQIEK